MITNSQILATEAKATVIVEIHSDGFIRVYGDRHIQAKIINRPLAKTAAAGRLVDELIDSILPQRFADVYFPGNVRATGLVKPIRPSDIQGVVYELEMLNAIGEPSRYHTSPKRRILAAMEA